jgi:hypothetical protein
MEKHILNLKHITLIGTASFKWKAKLLIITYEEFNYQLSHNILN